MMIDLLGFRITPTMISIAVCVSIMAIVLLYVIFRRTFKVASKFKIVIVSLVCYTLLAVIGSVSYYMYENEYLFSNQSKYYVYGKIREIDTNTMKIYVTSSSLDDEKEGLLKVELTKDTVYRSILINVNEKKILLEDVHAGDYVEVMCKEEKKGATNTVTAIKITKRNSNV